jgi:hypothetical protein
VAIPKLIQYQEYLPRVLPVGWRSKFVKHDVTAYKNEGKVLTVLISFATELDKKKWMHVSCSHPDRLPSWETLKEVKTLFVGRERQAVQVLPSEKKYINLHPYCLHLFCCLDEPDPVPDFTRGGDSL